MKIIMKFAHITLVVQALLLVCPRALVLGDAVCDAHDEVAMTPEAKCAVFKSYVDIKRHLVQVSKKPKDATSAVCETFSHLEPFACPSKHFLGKICADPLPGGSINKAVRRRYCQPWLRVCDLGEDEDECVRRCTRYVKDCCDVDCM